MRAWLATTVAVIAYVLFVLATDEKGREILNALGGYQ